MLVVVRNLYLNLFRDDLAVNKEAEKMRKIFIKYSRC